MEQYERRFFELRQYDGYADDEPMLIQHLVRGLNERIGGEVRMHGPKTLEVAVEKARLAEENLSLALGGAIGGQTVSAPVTGSTVRGPQ